MEQSITEDIIKQHNLSINEYNHIKDILQREPNITELGMYSVLWSEHCSYKSSKALLSTLPTKGHRIIQGPGENAGVIYIGDDLAVVMKVESHNHPSAIEPYQGAATGVGGIIRDIIAMGARPIALLNSLRFGKPNKGTNRHLFTKVVEGIGGYGNCIGIPTIGGEVYFEDCYDGNPLVNAMCVGIVKRKHIASAKASGLGNPVIYAGAPTGRDGIKGASFASKELHAKSEEDLPAVQVGDPFTGKLLIEASMEIAKKDYLVAMQDMGAAGLTSSSAEMVAKGNMGMEINLDLVPTRTKGLTPYEIMLSESQERMLLVVESGFEDNAIHIFRKWGLSACAIGKLTADEFLVLKSLGKTVAKVPAKSLSTPPISNLIAKKPEYLDKLQNIRLEQKEKEDYNKSLEKILSSPNIASKEDVYRQYDHMIGTNTILVPGSADACLLRIKGTSKAIALSIDGNSRYCYIDPFVGAKIAVCEAARNLACTGAYPIALTDGLNFGNPNDPAVFWTLKEVIRGIKEACNELDTPVVSGNVSLYNENDSIAKEDKAIYPSPIIGMLGLVSNLKYVVTKDFKDEDDIIILLGKSLDELGASEYLSVIHNSLGSKCPSINLATEKLIQETCIGLINKGVIKSAHDVSEGGLACTLSECCIGGDIGAFVSLDYFDISTEAALFGESQSRIVVSTSPSNIGTIRDYLEYLDIPFKEIGFVSKESYLKIDKHIDVAISNLKRAFESLRI